MSGFIRAEVDDNLSPRLAGALPGIRAGISRSVLRACLTLEGLVKRDISAHGPVSRGDLRKSIHSRVEDIPGSGVVVGHVEANVDYAREAHEGRNPGGAFPSVYGAILPWVRRSVRQGRLSLPTPAGGVRRDGRGRFKSDKEAQLESMAWAVAHGIHKHGTPGRPFFTIAVLAHEGRVVRQAKADVGRVMREAIAGGAR